MRIHWVARSCTTTAYRWLFGGSPSSLRTLWSAVIKSPNFSARGTASPVRPLQGALVILVRLQTSQFRSSGEWVLILYILDATFVGRSESEWWGMCAGAGTSVSSRFSVNPFDYSGRSRNRFPAAPSLSLFLFLFWVFGVSRQFPWCSIVTSLCCWTWRRTWWVLR